MVTRQAYKDLFVSENLCDIIASFLFLLCKPSYIIFEFLGTAVYGVDGCGEAGQEFMKFSI